MVKQQYSSSFPDESSCIYDAIPVINVALPPFYQKL